MIEEPKARKPKETEINRADISKLFEHLPPHSLEAEMCLLGSLIVAGTENIHLIGEVMQVLRSETDFVMPKHATIYRQVVEQYDQHQALAWCFRQRPLPALSQFDHRLAGADPPGGGSGQQGQGRFRQGRQAARIGADHRNRCCFALALGLGLGIGIAAGQGVDCHWPHDGQLQCPPWPHE